MKLKRSLFFLLLAIVGLMALGAGVRTMRAGLSCPDWPLCYGKVIPDFHVGVWFEFVHRAYAGGVALFFFALLIASWRLVRKGSQPKSLLYFGLAGFVVLLLQIAMGALTVLWLVKAYVVTTHLVLATVFFMMVYFMHWVAHGEKPAQVSFVASPRQYEFPSQELASSGSPFFRWSVLALPLAVFFQIILGGLVAATYAGYVCVDWPLCNGQWVPTWSGPIGLQVLHRFFAYGLFCLALWVVVQVHLRRMAPEVLRWSNIMLVGVTLQVVVGILNLILRIPPHLTVLHQVLAIFVLAASTRIHLLAGKSGWASGVDLRTEPSWLSRVSIWLRSEKA